MDLSLDPGTQRLIEKRVASGRYKSAEEVVAAAIAHLDQQDATAEMDAPTLERLYPDIRAALATGLAEARAGHLLDGEQFFDDLESEDGAAPDDVGRKSA